MFFLTGTGRGSRSVYSENVETSDLRNRGQENRPGEITWRKRIWHHYPAFRAFKLKYGG